MTVDFARWLAEEQAREADARARADRLVRPSLELPASLVARVDRVAAVSGMTRHELVAAALGFYLASWRQRP